MAQQEPPPWPTEPPAGDAAEYVVRIGDRDYALVPADRPRPPSTRSNIAIIIACLVVVLIGALAWSDNRARDQRDECLTQWAQDTTDTVQARAEGTKELREAQQRKSEADDAVTEVFVTAFLSATPPVQSELKEQFKMALQEFVKARRHLDRVQTRVAQQVEQNPYPVLDVHCSS